MNKRSLSHLRRELKKWPCYVLFDVTVLLKAGFQNN
jgi:hypothetical protein